jgi:carbon catabolite-derepressing protein kinase
LKEGVKAPGPSASAGSSRSDLEEVRRRLNLTGLTASGDDKHSAPTDKQTTSGASSASQPHSLPRISYGVWVFIDIQLYQLEENSYMVDFKCDGYQNVIRPEGDSDWHPISKRFRDMEKEVTSPYPFLDVASDLVAQLAVAA